MKKGFLDGYDTYDNSRGQGNAKAWRSAFRDRISKEQAEEILQRQPDTPHGILGVGLNATQTEIKKAFRQLINEWHPDKNPHRLHEAEEKSKQFIAAYSLLIH